MSRQREEKGRPRLRYKHDRAGERRRTKARISRVMGGGDGELDEHVTPGAGWHSKTGLRKPKPDPDNDYYGCADDLWSPTPTWQMDRAEFTEEIRRVGEDNREHERWLVEYTEKVRTRKVIEPVDIDFFIRAVTPETLYSFRGIFGRKMPEGPCTEGQRELAERLMNADLVDFTILREVQMRSDDADRMKEGVSAGYQAALRLLERKEHGKALDILIGISTAYLSDNGNAIPHKEGLEALELCRVIGRTKAAAAASVYAKHDTSEFEEVFGNRSFRNHPLSWGYGAVSALTLVGELIDLPLITKIGKDCWENNLELRCKRAQDIIRISEAVRLALPELTKEDKEHYGIPEHLSEQQLVRRLAWTFYSMGLGELIAKHKALAQFGRGYEGSPIFELLKGEKLEKLVTERLEQALDLSPEDHGGSLHWFLEIETNTAREFLLESRLAEKRQKERDCCRRRGCTELVLTERGKELVTGLMLEIAKMDIIYCGKTETLLPESHRVLPEEFKPAAPKTFKIANFKLLEE